MTRSLRSPDFERECNFFKVPISHPSILLQTHPMNLQKTLLNVGGNSKHIQLPEVYSGWKKVLLDIDSSIQPDICCDARNLLSLTPGEYDVVYCSHNLEHYYPHESPMVLQGFRHVINSKGAIDIHVPDLGQLMKIVINNDMDINDFLYQSAAGPITVHDVLFGYGVEIEKSGNDFFAHKTGFTVKSLEKLLKENGFPYVYSGIANLEIRAVAFLDTPNTFFKNLYQIA